MSQNRGSIRLFCHTTVTRHHFTHPLPVGRAEKNLITILPKECRELLLLSHEKTYWVNHAVRYTCVCLLWVLSGSVGAEWEVLPFAKKDALVKVKVGLR